jgi:shikimate kinase
VAPSFAKPHLVELAGPPGAGKSTVFRSLLARDQTIEGRPGLRTREYAGAFTREVLAVLGTLARERYRSRVTLEQVRMMAYLQALPRILERAPSPDRRIIAFDQGPVYYLTRPTLTNERLARWRRRVLHTWAPLLDVVVWLDAPDAVLVERINSRDKWHRLKGGPEGRALEVLTESRAAYETVLRELEMRRHGPAILRFDTSRRSADAIAHEVLAALHGKITPMAQRA